jgi:Phospholipase_D-nuclease N-terminal
MKPGSRKRWADLSTPQRAGVVAAGAVQLALLGAALADLARRADAEVNGSKRVWAAVSLVNFVGPLAYFAFGRRR